MSIEYKLCRNLILAGRIDGMKDKISLLVKHEKITKKEQDELLLLIDKWK